jgi:hypothetical protein
MLLHFVGAHGGNCSACAIHPTMASWQTRTRHRDTLGAV